MVRGINISRSMGLNNERATPIFEGEFDSSIYDKRNEDYSHIPLREQYE